MEPSFSKVKLNNLTISGFSRAGDATGLYIPELNIHLDAGTFHEKKPQAVFVTHSHSDHSYKVPYLYNREGVPLDVFTAAENAKFMYSYLVSAQQLNDCDEQIYEKFKIHNVKPGDEFDYITTNKKRLTIQVIKCFHTVPCVGYLFFEKRKRLKEKYKSMPGKELAALRKQAASSQQATHASSVSATTIGKVEASAAADDDEFMEEVKVPLFAFLGDTTPEIFEAYGKSHLFQFPTIIVECTFLQGEQENSKGHMYWSGLKKWVVDNPSTQFLLIHFSHMLRRQEIVKFFEDEKVPNAIPFI